MYVHMYKCSTSSEWEREQEIGKDEQREATVDQVDRQT